MNLAALRSRLSSTTAVLTVSVLAGTADLVTAQSKETVPAGQSRRVAAPDPAAPARAGQLYAAVRTELPEPTDEKGELAWKDMDEKQQLLAQLLLQQPAAMAAIRKPLARDLADARLSVQTRGRLIGLALLDEDRTTLAAVTELWTSAPDRFDFEEQVALAERGFAPAAAKLHEFLKEPNGVMSARAAAALAFGGDASVREALQPWTEVTMDAAEQDIQQFDARCQAAIALASVGDREAMANLRSWLRTFVERMFAAGNVQLTPQFLQRAQYYLASPKPRLHWLDLRLRASETAELGDGTDVARVRALLQKLAPK